MGSGKNEIQGHGQTYKLLRHIGQGGFGDVYLARATTQGGISRTVAIKLLRRLVDQESVIAKRLRDEARLLGMLDHRNIVRAEDLLEVDGRPALVMEYVPGANLNWLIHPRSNPAPLPPEILLEIMQQVADALDSAWRRPSRVTGQPLQVLHRDIKPSNIRVTPEGEVKVLDFGISRPEGMDREARTQRAPPGSRNYAAPEMFMGGALGPGIDMYALAVTTYECMARKNLGIAQDRASAHHLSIQEKLETLDLVAWGEVSNPMCRLLARMLSFEPNERPSAQEVRSRAQELRGGLSGIGLEHWAPQVVPNVVKISSRENDGPLTGMEVHSQASLDSEAPTVRVERPAQRQPQEAGPVPVPPTEHTVITPPAQFTWQTALAVATVLLIAGVMIGALLRNQPPPPKVQMAPPPTTQGVLGIPEPASTTEAEESPPVAEPTTLAPPPPKLLEAMAPSPKATPIEIVLGSIPMGIGVSIDNVPVGSTPMRIPLAPGSYQLRFHAAQPMTQDIRVEEGGKTRWQYDGASRLIR